MTALRFIRLSDGKLIPAVLVSESATGCECLVEWGSALVHPMHLLEVVVLGPSRWKRTATITPSA